MEKFIFIKRLFFVTVFCLNIVTFGFAVDITWTGGGDGTSWSDPLNWSPNMVPGTADKAIFNTAVSIDPAGATIAQLEVNNGAAVILTGNVTVTVASAPGNELINIDNGSLEVAMGNSLTISGGDANDVGINLGANSTFINNGNTFINSTYVQAIKVNDATSTVNNNMCATIDLGTGRIRSTDGGATIKNDGLFKYNNTATINNGGANYIDNGFYINPAGGNGSNVGVNASAPITLSACNMMGISAAYDWYTDPTTQDATTQVGSNTTAGLYTGTLTSTIPIYTCFGSDVSFAPDFTFDPTITVTDASGTTSNDGIICNGDGATLTASGGISYAWSPATGLSAINIANPTTTASTSTTYMVTVTDANGCTDTETFTITVNENTTASQANITPVCEGGTIELIGRPGDGSIPDANFNWTGPNGFTATGIRKPTIPNATLANAGDYIVTVTDVNGCTKAITKTAVVYANPVATAANNGPICEGATLSLTGGPNSMTTYAWSGPNYSNTTQSPIISTSATTAMSGNYTITITDGNGCTDTETTAVTINPFPDATLTVSDPKICCEEIATITLSNSVSGINYQLRLNSDDSNVGTTVAGTGGDITFMVNPTADLTYNILATNASTGCSVELADKANVIVNTTWIGGATGDWNDVANWSNGVPSTTCIAIFKTATTVTGTIPTGYNIAGIDARSSADVTLNLTGKLTTNATCDHGVDVSGSANLNLAGGNYCFKTNNNGTDSYNGVNIGGTGNLTVNQGVKVDIMPTTGSTVLEDRGIHIGATATATNSGVIRMMGNLFRGLNIGGGGLFTNNACASLTTVGTDRSININSGGLLTNSGYLAAAETNTNSNQDRINTTNGFYTSTGSFDPMEGTAIDGEIVACEIIVENISTCGFDGTNSFYTADVKIEFANPPATTGTITLSGGALLSPIAPTIGTISGNTMTLSNVKFLADGNPINLTAVHNIGTTNCSISNTNAGTAPTACPNACGLLSITISNISACNPNGTVPTCQSMNVPTDDTYTVDVTVTFANPPTVGNLVLSGDVAVRLPVSSLSGNTQTFTGLVLPADGSQLSITAIFDNIPSCTLTNLNAGTAPSECSTVQNNKTWVGGASGDWNVAANWSGNCVPSLNDQVKFNTDAEVTGAPLSPIDRLLIQNGATVNFNLTGLTVSRKFTNDGRSSVVQVDTNSVLLLNTGDYNFSDGGTCDVINDIISVNKQGAKLVLNCGARVTVNPGAIGTVNNPTSGKDGLQINNGAQLVNHGSILIQGGFTGHGMNINNGSMYTGGGIITIEPFITKNAINVNNSSVLLIQECGRIINNNSANTRIVVANGSSLSNYGVIISESSDVGVQVNGIGSVGVNNSFYSYRNGNLFAKSDEFGTIRDNGNDLDIDEALATYLDPHYLIQCNANYCYNITEGIPTMSQWGLLIFGLLILNLSLILLMKFSLVQKR